MLDRGVFSLTAIQNFGTEISMFLMNWQKDSIGYHFVQSEKFLGCKMPDSLNPTFSKTIFFTVTKKSLWKGGESGL